MIQKFLIFPYLVCNIIMTGESAHTASKEMIVPGLMFPSECAPAINYLLQSEVGITLCFWYVQPVLHMKNNRSTSATNPVTMKNIDNLQLSITDSRVAIMLRF